MRRPSRRLFDKRKEVLIQDCLKENNLKNVAGNELQLIIDTTVKGQKDHCRLSSKDIKLNRLQFK